MFDPEISNPIVSDIQISTGLNENTTIYKNRIQPITQITLLLLNASARCFAPTCPISLQYMINLIITLTEIYMKVHNIRRYSLYHCLASSLYFVLWHRQFYNRPAIPYRTPMWTKISDELFNIEKYEIYLSISIVSIDNLIESFANISHRT